MSETNRMFFRAIVLCSLAIAATLLSGCESEGASYNRGFAAGRAEGVSQATERAYSEGYRAGYMTARPSAEQTLGTGATVTLNGLALIGALKIIIGLILAAFFVIRKSKSEYGQAAMLLAGVVAAASAYLLTSLTYVDQIFVPVLLASANWPRFLLVAPILVGYVIGYWSAKSFRSLVRRVDGIHVEVAVVAMTGFLGVFLGNLLVQAFLLNPAPESYFISYLLCGLALGGAGVVIKHLIEFERAARTKV